VNVPEFFPVAQRKLDALLADGWTINGYAIMKGEHRRGFVDHGGFVGWWLPEYYAGHSSDLKLSPDIMLAEMKAAAGYLRNARIDLETGATKATAIRTIEGGLRRLEAAISKAEVVE
jgi:hypothetical protein